MLLVTDTAGIFHNQDSDSGYTSFWNVTWKRIDFFLPGHKDEVFKPPFLGETLRDDVFAKKWRFFHDRDQMICFQFPLKSPRCVLNEVLNGDYLCLVALNRQHKIKCRLRLTKTFELMRICLKRWSGSIRLRVGFSKSGFEFLRSIPNAAVFAVFVWSSAAINSLLVWMSFDPNSERRWWSFTLWQQINTLHKPINYKEVVGKSVANNAVNSTFICRTAEARTCRSAFTRSSTWRCSSAAPTPTFFPPHL